MLPYSLLSLLLRLFCPPALFSSAVYCGMTLPPFFPLLSSTNISSRDPQRACRLSKAVLVTTSEKAASNGTLSSCWEGGCSQNSQADTNQHLNEAGKVLHPLLILFCLYCIAPVAVKPLAPIGCCDSTECSQPSCQNVCNPYSLRKGKHVSLTRVEA